MKVTVDNFTEFNNMIGFWGGAQNVWNSFSDGDRALLDSLSEEMTFDSLTEVNDYIWFEAEDFLTAVREFDEISLQIGEIKK